VLAICSAVGLPGVAGARHAANTKVTIHYNGDGFFGKLKSSKARCRKNRGVKVIRKSTGEKLHSDFTDQEGRWSTGNSGPASGAFQARTRRIPGCKGDKSRTLHI
jgi:hypothetical protein